MGQAYFVHDRANAHQVESSSLGGFEDPADRQRSTSPRQSSDLPIVCTIAFAPSIPPGRPTSSATSLGSDGSRIATWIPSSAK